MLSCICLSENEPGGHAAAAPEPSQQLPPPASDGLPACECAQPASQTHLAPAAWPVIAAMLDQEQCMPLIAR